MIGATTRSACTSAYQSVRNAASSPSQKRRRERRMYQFERSSTNASNARIDVDGQERLVGGVASSTSAAVRATSQRSSGCRARRLVARDPPSAAPSPRCRRTWTRNAGRVPERQQLALDLVAGPEAEEQVAVGRLRAVLPAHHVGAHARERVAARRSCCPTSRASRGRARRASSRSRAPAGTARGPSARPT